MCGKMLDSMYMVLRMAVIAICLLQAPVITSFPDENSRAVVFGSSMRTVMAACSGFLELCCAYMCVE